ncbi:MAG: hypothetical protein KAW94_03025 [Candidatus Thorarchaeota archaeon]|nr:hypothetical protein [Candidatus Thorarchaeota archaeon]
MKHSFRSNARNITLVRNLLIEWFDKKGRSFPWRETTDPYRVLIAEILLRRTTAAAVLRVYPNFIKRFDNPAKLSRARKSTIRRHLNTLGLQSIRAKQIHETAKYLSKEHAGSVPDSLPELESLPGVGRYVGAAVLSFAFGQPEPMVDGNVVHLVNRVFGSDFKGAIDSRAWEFMERFGGKKQDKRLYWGIIDLVATICLRRFPRCSQCPLNNLCEYCSRNVNEDGTT